ncbi:MAG: ferrous iron transport protein B [Peptostreptococcaceae bacterium]|nr:ferrous iron transport protein B [Peptostreptococcaceae bacterium]
MGINVALAGNPNSGKTTMYNVLTGSAQYVGNWPGVTVEKKAGKYKKNKDIVIVDLPGIYSLSPYTLEEVVSRNYLLDETPDVILNMVDASNIERNLYLTTQMLELNIPVVIALNMMDVVKKRGDTIDTEKLEKEFGCKIVEVSALRQEGIDTLMSEVEKAASSKKGQKVEFKFSDDVEQVIEKISNTSSVSSSKNKRWTSIKLFERDEKLLETFSFSGDDRSVIENMIEEVENKLDDDSESIITNERYEVITKIVSSAVDKVKMTMTLSDRIDSIVTNRILALPIFVGIMWLVYYITVGTVGTKASDYVNDVIFGDDGIPAMVGSLLESMGVGEVLSGLILKGIVAGVGAVLGFLPLIIVLYLCLGILEDIGYMSRVAFVMDRIFRKFGLSGKSFIPFLIGTGCSVPGIMGARTIENEKDRRMTVTITSFMPCGAKAPIIALIAVAAFDKAAWLGPLTYVLGVLAIIVSGIILKKTKMFSGDPAPFIMELPQYHMPFWKNILLHVWERTKSYAIKAGTVILASTILLWILMNFTPSFKFISFEENNDTSIIAVIGSAIAPLFAPLGFGTWEGTVATFTGLIAKENVISTMGMVSKMGEIDPETAVENAEFVAVAAKMFSNGAVGAFSFMMFNLFCVPCFAAVGAIKREMNDAKWTIFALCYQTLFAYVVAFVCYQIGIVLFSGVGFSIGTILAIILVLISLYLLFRPYTQEEMKRVKNLN